MKPIFSLLLFLSLASLSLSTTTFKAVSDEDKQCVYTLYIQTGYIPAAGTDSVISAAFAGPDGSWFLITDLPKWGGLMGPDHDYFEKGNLDIFSGRGPCLSEPPCMMNLTSDGSGQAPNWFCEYVKLTTTGPDVGCAQQLFVVQELLATDVGYAFRTNCTPAPEAGSGLEGIMSREARAMRAGA